MQISEVEEVSRNEVMLLSTDRTNVHGKFIVG